MKFDKKVGPLKKFNSNPNNTNDSLSIVIKTVISVQLLCQKPIEVNTKLDDNFFTRNIMECAIQGSSTCQNNL